MAPKKHTQAPQIACNPKLTPKAKRTADVVLVVETRQIEPQNKQANKSKWALLAQNKTNPLQAQNQKTTVLGNVQAVGGIGANLFGTNYQQIKT